MSKTLTSKEVIDFSKLTGMDPLAVRRELIADGHLELLMPPAEIPTPVSALKPKSQPQTVGADMIDLSKVVPNAAPSRPESSYSVLVREVVPSSVYWGLLGLTALSILTLCAVILRRR